MSVIAVETADLWLQRTSRVIDSAEDVQVWMWAWEGTAWATEGTYIVDVNKGRSFDGSDMTAAQSHCGSIRGRIACGLRGGVTTPCPNLMEVSTRGNVNDHAKRAFLDYDARFIDRRRPRVADNGYHCLNFRYIFRYSVLPLDRSKSLHASSGTTRCTQVSHLARAQSKLTHTSSLRPLLFRSLYALSNTGHVQIALHHALLILPRPPVDRNQACLKLCVSTPDHDAATQVHKALLIQSFCMLTFPLLKLEVDVLWQQICEYEERLVWEGAEDVQHSGSKRENELHERLKERTLWLSKKGDVVLLIIRLAPSK